jgi:hypothetical protein
MDNFKNYDRYYRLCRCEKKDAEAPRTVISAAALKANDADRVAWVFSSRTAIDTDQVFATSKRQS